MQTDRLLLTPWLPNEAEAMHACFNNESVRKYLWDDQEISKEMVDKILQTNLEQFENQHFGLWKLTERNDTHFVGFAGLWFFFEEKQPQLLYGLWPAFEGNGYATEASKKVLTYAFSSLNYSYVDAAIDSPHEASRKVLERLNMKLLAERMEDNKPTSFYRATR